MENPFDRRRLLQSMGWLLSGYGFMDVLVGERSSERGEKYDSENARRQSMMDIDF